MTGAGARLLASRLVAPLTDVAAIDGAPRCRRFYGRRRRRCAKTCAMHCGRRPILNARLARLALGRGGPRDLAAVARRVAQAEAMRSALLAARERCRRICATQTQNLGEHNALIDRLERALAADLPLLARDGNFIARGYAPQLDELVTLRDDSRRLIAGLQQKYAASGGVSGSRSGTIRSSAITSK